MLNNLLNQQESLDFILGGNSRFTFKSLKTQSHLTFKVIVPKSNSKDTSKIFYVSVLSGTDNDSNYTYIGYIKKENSTLNFYPTQKLNAKVTSIEVFKFVFDRLVQKITLTNLEIYHEGKCCRCGRTLTTPESIKLGIGPECIKIKSKINELKLAK